MKSFNQSHKMQAGKSDWTMPCDRWKGARQEEIHCVILGMLLQHGICNSHFTITCNIKFKVNARSYEGRTELTKQTGADTSLCMHFPFPTHFFQYNQNRKWLAGRRGGLKVTRVVVNLPWILIYVFFKMWTASRW